MFYSKKLKQFNEIKHCFFSRKKGFSKGLYSSLNCGKGSKDKKRIVKKNLNFVSNKMNIKPNCLFLMNQTHSNKVIEIKRKKFKKKINSDAMITRVKNITLGVVTADCVPILLFDTKSKMIGCIHAGWRGAFSGIIKNTIYKMKKKNQNNKIFACIGPCIAKKSYEVDQKFFKKFKAKSNSNIKYFSKKNRTKKYFNLRRFVSDQLTELNVSVDHINKDTFKDTKNFFSFRRYEIFSQIQIV